ncbi:hypothetical protein [Paenibacillus sp. Y412MC10]|uniref:hypothetical protein n=1 Tax=Geobacillus sp. (strain Y412MC10) TaxID=481743 RepID=UPI0011AB4ED3|nr:hypothetical protein [Paenibacillus sp. Y412MC10]
MEILDEQEVWTLGKAAEYLQQEHGIEIKVVTLRSWFNELEKLKVHTLPRTPNKRERVLTRNELDIAIFIHETRAKYGKKLSTEVIAQSIRNSDKFQTHYIEEEDVNSENTEMFSMEQMLGKVTEELNNRLEEAIETIRQEYELKEEEARLALPDPSVKLEEDRIAMRTYQFNLWEAERKARKELSDEAKRKWDENPIKTGFLFKKEDSAKRLEFITSYIEENVVERVKKIIENN